MQPSKVQPQVESLQGVVERLTYHSEESGYTVARLKAPRTRELVTIVGNFANIQAGQTLQMQGIWREHPKYGPQFQVRQYRETKPATLTGIERYLGSGLIKGVGPVTAKRIVAHFGLETLDIIEHQIERLVEVPGIAKKRVQMIQETWQTQKAIKEVMIFLQGHGVSTTYAVKIYKQYEDDAIQIVTENPYRLSTDVYGIGFVIADEIARSLGVHPNSEFRYRAGILHVLSEASTDGHCFLPQSELIERTAKRLALPGHQIHPEDIESLTTFMSIDEELVLQGGSGQWQRQFLCYAPPFFYAEQGIAHRIKRLLTAPAAVDATKVERWMERFTVNSGMTLSEEQKQAVRLAATHRLLILTGGPGVGKSFTCRTIVALWKAMGKTVVLASPTGRAAQRLSELTGEEAKTLHRLLEFAPKNGKFKRDQDNPIPADAVVVDEASMLDLFLANSLLKAIAPKTHLLLVGDIDQLPSVGPGAILQDLMASEQVPVARLTQVFRQAQTSAIVTNAHRINQGDFPQLEPVSGQPQTDCLWFEAEQPEQGVAAIRDIMTHLIPQLGYSPATDVQVLCPMIKGEVGTRNLNQVLQQVLNPPSPQKAEITRGGIKFRVGDRILQQRNDYTHEVFNGDLGVVTAIDSDELELTAQFSDRQVTYDHADPDEIALAFAITIHKSQGSEYPVVIVPVFMQHYIMLSRNLLYTAVTRARQLVVLVGSQKAIDLAVRQVKDQERYTLLAHRLQRTDK
jgi:exodeoxyribonuclease V alpha subunit